jgi:hypothetical protein
MRGSNKALKRVMAAVLKDDAELYKQFSDDLYSTNGCKAASMNR